MIQFRSLVACILLVGGVALFITGTPVSAEDLHFQVIDSVQFPASHPIIQWRLADVNGDGLDELIALSWDHYYVYSFARDSIFLAATYPNNLPSMPFMGQYVTDYDKDGQLDILVLDSRGQMFLQSGTVVPNQRIIDTLSAFTGPPTSPHGIKLDLVDLAHDGDTTLIGGGLTEYVISMEIPRDVEVYYAGNIAVIHPSDFSAVWWRHATSIPSSEYLACLNLAGDSVLNVCSWGQSYHEWTVHPPWGGEYQERTYSYQFSIYDHAGTMMKAAASLSGIAAVGGALIPGRTSDEIVVFKDGPSFDSTVFKPSRSWGMYCLGIESDTLSILWARDGWALGQVGLFRLPSLPHTFSAWTSSSHCGIFSGSDGSEIGLIVGLRANYETKQGQLIAGSDSLIQVVQVSGTKAILSLQQSPTGIDDPSEQLPESFQLLQNYPNPFNAGTTIRFRLPRTSQVRLDILNLLGQIVVTLSNGKLPAGPHSVQWNGTDGNGSPVASGMYFYRIEVDGIPESRKMTLLK